MLILLIKAAALDPSLNGFPKKGNTALNPVFTALAIAAGAPVPLAASNSDKMLSYVVSAKSLPVGAVSTFVSSFFASASTAPVIVG